jgi:hypothetical protein
VEETDMFKKGLPIGTIVVILVIALAAIGVGYGLWSKVLFISGTVQTGNVNAVFVSASTNDDGAGDILNPYDPLDPGYTKDVGSCTVAITGEAHDQLTITILNGYPSYSCTVDFTVRNSGSIPVMVQAFNFTGLPPVLDLTLPGDPQNWLSVGDQIDPDHEVAGALTVHVRQEAEETTDPQNPVVYSFSAAITLVQWNEYRATGAMALCQKDDSNWICVPGATGVLYYPPSAQTFDYDFNAEGLTPGTSYTLIYYPGEWPGNGLIVLGAGTADADGDLHLVGSPNIGDLTNAKIWLVLTADVGAGQMTGWNPAAYLFEETLITYDDTGP